MNMAAGRRQTTAGNEESHRTHRKIENLAFQVVRKVQGRVKLDLNKSAKPRSKPRK